MKKIKNYVRKKVYTSSELAELVDTTDLDSKWMQVAQEAMESKVSKEKFKDYLELKKRIKTE